MGIGRKGTDQRTSCRKFLATPLVKRQRREGLRVVGAEGWVPDGCALILCVGFGERLCFLLVWGGGCAFGPPKIQFLNENRVF